MKILVLGATGMVGSRIVDEALARGHSIIAASRSGEDDARGNVETVALDIHKSDNLAELTNRVDLIVSAISPRNGGNPSEEARSFTRALIEAAGDTRIIQVGGAASLTTADGGLVLDRVPDDVRPEATAMFEGVELLSSSDANWTVLAPAMMISPGERTGTARVGDRTLMTDEAGASRISAEDFALVLLNEAENPAHTKQIFNAAY